LTDGAAWDIATCVQRTEVAIRDLPGPKTFLRVLTVGIGNGVSTDTCDSIARAGNGISVYVNQGEAMAGKCARLIRAARTPPVVDLEVFWPGHDEAMELGKDDADIELVEAETAPSDLVQPEPVSLFQDNAEKDCNDVGPPPKPKVTLPSPPAIQQAPIIPISSRGQKLSSMPSYPIHASQKARLFFLLPKSVVRLQRQEAKWN
jgi:hypothetical protein